MANAWPNGWPTVSDMLLWAAEKWRGAATHDWIPLREIERQHVRDQLPEYVVCEHSAFMMLLQVAGADVNCRHYTRYHCTGFRTLADISAAKKPFKHRLLPGWSFSANKPGIYISESATGALTYYYGSPNDHQLAALLILRTDTAGAKVGKTSSNKVIRPSNDTHEVVGAIVFKANKFPTCDPPTVGETVHPIVQLPNIDLDYRNYVLKVFGCDDNGIFRGLPGFLTGISTYSPPLADESDEDDGDNWISTFPLQLSQGSEKVMETIIALGDNMREIRDVMFWQKHQDEFQGWGSLPTHQWYCRTKSYRVCVWDSQRGKTVWPTNDLRPPLPVPIVPVSQGSQDVHGTSFETLGSSLSSSSSRLPAMTTELLLAPPEIADSVPEQAQLPPTGDCQSKALFLDMLEDPDFSDSSDSPGQGPNLPASEGDTWEFMSPRLRDVTKERLHFLQRSDIPIFVERMKSAGWTSILCSNLWKEPLSAQQEVIQLGDPGRVRTLCGDIFVACKILCQRARDAKVQKFTEVNRTNFIQHDIAPEAPNSSSSQSRPMTLPPGVSLPLQVGTSVTLSDEMQLLADKMWKEFRSAAKLCPVGQTLDKAPLMVLDSMKIIFCKRCSDMTPATAKARTRALTRWKFFCEEVGIDPFPFETHWLAVFLQSLSGQGQSVPATTMAQLKIWAEWLSISFPSDDSFVLAAISSGSIQAPIKQAEPISPAVLWFWEWCLGDPRDVVVWIAAIWLLLSMGTLRYIHLTRSCITHCCEKGFYGFCSLGKSRSSGKRAPFRWCCPRIMPGGTDLHQVLMRLISTFEFTSTVENPKGMIPDTIPSRAPFDLVQGFGSSSMTLYTFHKLSRQIVLAAKPGFDVTTLSSYSARRLLPSVAELWHVPTEMRNKIGGWNKDEVREQVKNRMPDRYSHFKLESALQVKTTIVRNLARLVGDIRASSDLSTWPDLCSRIECDVSTISTAPTKSTTQSTCVQSRSSSESSTSSSSSSGEDLVKRKCGDATILPWLKMPSGKVLHVRENTQPLCGHFIADTSCQTGSTMESAIATGTPLCDRCWRKLDADSKHKWIGRIS